MKIRFKMDARETGLRSIVQERGTDIKSGTAKIGRLYPPSRYTGENNWKVGVVVYRDPAVVNAEHPCEWAWLTFKPRFESEAKAREWVVKSWAEIESKFKIYKLED